jgi:hypothetical protein
MACFSESRTGVFDIRTISWNETDPVSASTGGGRMRGLADHVLPLSRNLGRAGLLNVSQLDFYREGQVWGSLRQASGRQLKKEEKWPSS